MSTTLDTSSFETAVETKCHVLPCTINKNSDAKVEEFFESTVRENDHGLTASFRGRPLNGQEIVLPAGYTGLVLREQGMAATEDEDRVLRVDKKFTSFTAWNLDKPPSADDKVDKTLQWLAIAKALHRPVDEDSSSQRSITGK